VSTPGQQRGHRPAAAGHGPDAPKAGLGRYGAARQGAPAGVGRDANSNHPGGDGEEGETADGEAVGQPITGQPSKGGHSEHETLAWLNALLPPPPNGEVWAGDDAAAVAWPGAGSSSQGSVLLLTADTVVAGLDADLSLTSLSDLGWKAMAVNLSDIAAMGGVPGHALVTVVGAGPDELRSLYEGILEAAAAYDCPVVGGDLSAGSEMVVSVSLTGRVDGPPVLRSGARPGDTIWVSGPLGAAAAGLRLLKDVGPAAHHGWSQAETDLVRAHARPRPALVEGTLARIAGATAMIDVSDGLVGDLSHIANLSGVGFELTDVPVAPGATLAEALAGGDDYVLAFTMPSSGHSSGTGSGTGLATRRSTGPGTEPAAAPAAPPGTEVPRDRSSSLAGAFRLAGLSPPYPIGKCVPDPSKRLLAGRALEVSGWDHSL
jgi:thiamine-monophosphate kinase